MNDTKKSGPISETVSRRLDIMKALSVFSVICAHCNAVPEAVSAWNMTVHYLLNAVGTIGVGVFYGISGYLMIKQPKTSFSVFITKKIKRLVPAWMILGTMVYFYVAVRKWGVSVQGWLRFIMGLGSYLYFVPVLFLLYTAGFFIQYVKKSGRRYYRLLNVCLISISVLSNIMTYAGLISNTYAFINPMNWYVFFGIGICMADLSFKIPSWVFVISGTITAAVLFAVSFGQIWLHYWTPGFLLFEIAAGVFVEGAAKAAETAKRSFFFCSVGKQSLFLYLAHMPVAGIVANICGRVDFWMLTLLRPFIVLSVTWLGLVLYCKIVKKLNLNSVFYKMLGIRY